MNLKQAGINIKNTRLDMAFCLVALLTGTAFFTAMAIYYNEALALLAFVVGLTCLIGIIEIIRGSPVWVKQCN